MDKRWRRIVAVVIVACCIAIGSTAGAQPPSAASQDGFVPVSRAAQPETVPASRLVLAAYGFAWVMLFGYLWSIWTRIGRVERELHVVKRRVDAGERRT
jgi:CcmD family protein